MCDIAPRLCLSIMLACKTLNTIMLACKILNKKVGKRSKTSLFRNVQKTHVTHEDEQYNKCITLLMLYYHSHL